MSEELETSVDRVRGAGATAEREGEFSTPSKRARLTVHPLPAHDLAEEQLLLTRCTATISSKRRSTARTSKPIVVTLERA